MNILAIDTANETLSVAVATNRSKNAAGLFFEYASRAGYKHSVTLAPAIERLLAEAQIRATELDLIALSGGPGSFTGLRIGMATAKGLRAAGGAAIVSVPTLLAHGRLVSESSGIVVPLSDARKKRFYARLIHEGRGIGEDLDIDALDLVKDIERLRTNDERVRITGPGTELFFDRIGEHGKAYDAVPYPDRPIAASLIDIALERYDAGEIDDDAQGPLYLRESDVGPARPSPRNGS